MRLIQLLKKLQMEQVRDADRREREQLRREREEIRLHHVQRWTPEPETPVQEGKKRLRELRAETAAIKEELELNRQYEIELQKNAKASLELKYANETLEEREEREASTYRIQMAQSRRCAEAHPEWKSHARLAFNSQYHSRSRTAK